MKQMTLPKAVLTAALILLTGLVTLSFAHGGGSTSGGMDGQQGGMSNQQGSGYPSMMGSSSGMGMMGSTDQMPMDSGYGPMMFPENDNEYIPMMHNFRGTHGPQSYMAFEVETNDDIFMNPERFMAFTGGIQFVDEDEDGIADMFQDSELFHQMDFGEWMDRNMDGIGDMFQTMGSYRFMGMQNFVDVDGDGLCDNYESDPMGGFMGSHMSNFRGVHGSQMYTAFDVDTSDDIFMNADRFMHMTGMDFVDENEDGIADIFQDSELYHSMGFMDWTDENEDGIGDIFQTFRMYLLMGLDNFVDIDGDGLSDNYEKNPAEE